MSCKDNIVYWWSLLACSFDLAVVYNFLMQKCTPVLLSLGSIVITILTIVTLIQKWKIQREKLRGDELDK